MSYKDENKSLTLSEIKKIIKYSLFFPQNLFLGIALTILALLGNLLSPFILRDIIDNKLVQENLSYLILFQTVGYYFIVELFSAFFRYTGIVELKIVSAKVAQKVRLEIYDKLQRVRVHYFDSTPVGSIVSKITNDTKAMEDLYTNIYGQFFTSFIGLAGVFIALLFINPVFAFICLGIIFSFILIITLSTNYVNKFNYTVRQKISELNSIINESIQGISIIRAFNSQKKVLDEFDNVNETKFSNEMRLLLVESALSHNVIALIRNVATLILIYYFGRKYLDLPDSVTVGTIYVYMNYLDLIFRQSYGIFEKMPQMQRAIIGAKHIFETLDIDEFTEKEDNISDVEGNVTFENIYFAYKEEEYVLKDINFEVKKGETVGIVGHTGSGKSSIINLLMRFYYAQQGSIKIDNKDISYYSEKSIRKNMGIVLQEPFLFEGTILSNITLNNPDITREMAEHSLKVLGGEIVTNTLENGIDEKVFERGSTLSAGQRQLISFARALAHNPKILILDEATSSIDSETEKTVQNAMNILMEGRTTFVIAHRLSTIRNADKIIFLEKGKILEIGKHDELIDKKGKYYEMYQAQSKIKK